MNIKLKKSSIPYSGWTIKSDNGQKTVDLSQMVLHLEPEQKIRYISGTEMRTRMEGKGMSAAVLDYLIEHPEETPESWKENENGDINFIFFWGTIYRDSDGRLCVRYWCFHEGRWQSDYDWLDNHWGGQYPAAVLASTLTSEPESESESSTQNLGSLVARVEALEAIVKHHNLSV